jgi:hypothetical protein
MVLLGRRGKGRVFPAHFPGCMHIPGGLQHYRREAGGELPTNGPTVKVLDLMIISLYSNKEISMSGINYQTLRNYAWAAGHAQLRSPWGGGRDCSSMSRTSGFARRKISPAHGTACAKRYARARSPSRSARACWRTSLPCACQRPGPNPRRGTGGPSSGRTRACASGSCARGPIWARRSESGSPAVASTPRPRSCWPRPP